MQSTMGSNQSIRKSIESKGYQIISTIGKGSFGIVYKVRKYYYFGFLYKLSKYNFDDQCYAIKCETRMYMDEDKRMREVLIGKKLNHPNIVHIIDHFFGVNEMLYQIMEICECNLSKWFTDYPKNREYNRCIEMFNGITNGLKYIHEKNIIHRNLNPNNVLIKNGMCKVADFGLSVETNDERSHSSGVGNIIYAAPEVFGRHYDFKVDIYSLGCIFCEFFTEFNSNELRKSALANITVRIPENFFIKISDYNTRAKKLLKKMIDDNPINRPSMDFITSECSFIRNRLKNLPSSGFSRSLYRFYRLLIDDPLPYITVHPLEDNVLEWHYVLRGVEDTPYFGGIYYGKVVYSKDYPFSPPAVYMITPSGRFECNKRICMSSRYGRLWCPAMCVKLFLDLLCLMSEDIVGDGCIVETDKIRRKLAKQSWIFNSNNAVFCKLFPDLVRSSVHN